MSEAVLFRLAQVKNCPLGQGGPSCNTNLPEVAADASTASTFMALVFGVLGAVCVLLIIYAGFQFILGGDDPNKVKNARNTIIWALIGLGVALLAEAIVFLILGRV